MGVGGGRRGVGGAGGGGRGGSEGLQSWSGAPMTPPPWLGRGQTPRRAFTYTSHHSDRAPWGCRGGWGQGVEADGAAWQHPIACSVTAGLPQNGPMPKPKLLLASPMKQPDRTHLPCSMSPGMQQRAPTTKPLPTPPAANHLTNLQHERGLADPRVAANEDQRARDHAAAQYPATPGSSKRGEGLYACG